MKTVLITGCSSGIGLDAAHFMRGRGWRVIATCRKPEDIEARRAEGFDTLHLELGDEVLDMYKVLEQLESYMQIEAVEGGHHRLAHPQDRTFWRGLLP